MMRRRSQMEGCMQLAMSRRAYKNIYPRYLVILGIIEEITRKLDLDAEETCNFSIMNALRNGNLKKHRLGLTQKKGPPAGQNVGLSEDSGASVISGAWLRVGNIKFYSYMSTLKSLVGTAIKLSFCNSPFLSIQEMTSESISMAV